MSEIILKKVIEKDNVSEICYSTANNIINLIEALGFTSERKPSYKTELQDLLAVEVRRSIEKAGEKFYKNVSV